MLAECLEGLGDLGAALLQFRAALRLAPGDRQTEQQIRALEQRLAGAGGSRPVAAPPPPPMAAPPPPPPAPPPSSSPGPCSPCRWLRPPCRRHRRPAAAAALCRHACHLCRRPAPPAAPRPRRLPMPAADFDDVFETAPSWQRASTPAGVPAHEAILLLEDEAPTLPAAPPSGAAPGRGPGSTPPRHHGRRSPPPPVQPRAGAAAPRAPVPRRLLRSACCRATCCRATGARRLRRAASDFGATPALPAPTPWPLARTDFLFPPQAPLTLAFEPASGDRAGLLLRGLARGPWSPAPIRLAGKPAPTRGAACSLPVAPRRRPRPSAPAVAASPTAAPEPFRPRARPEPKLRPSAPRPWPSSTSTRASPTRPSRCTRSFSSASRRTNVPAPA